MESPSAATTIRGLGRSGIGALCDRLGYPFFLLDDVIAVPPVDDSLQVRAFVTGVDREPVRVRAKLFVLRVRHRDALHAGDVAAFADEVERLRLQSEAPGAGFDPLVHLPEH